MGTVDADMELTGVWVVVGGKDAPLESGRGRVGPEAVPTGLPSPGNLEAEEAGAASLAALAAWYSAALCLFLACLAGPRLLTT